VSVGTAEGFSELVHPESAYIAAESEVDAASPWVKSVLSSVVGATKSTIVSLAFLRRGVDVGGAFECSRLEEEWQIRQHGEVEDGHENMRNYLRLQLSSAAAFLSLLPLHSLPPPLDTSSQTAVMASKEEREARVKSRREKELELVNRKRAAMKELARREAVGEVSTTVDVTARSTK